MHWFLAHGMQSPQVVKVQTQLDSGVHWLTPFFDSAFLCCGFISQQALPSR